MLSGGIDIKKVCGDAMVPDAKINDCEKAVKDQFEPDVGLACIAAYENKKGIGDRKLADSCYEKFSPTMWNESELDTLATPSMGKPTFTNYIASNGLGGKSLATYYTDIVANFKASLAPTAPAPVVTKANVLIEIEKLFNPAISADKQVLDKLEALKNDCSRNAPKGGAQICFDTLENELLKFYQAAPGDKVSLGVMINLMPMPTAAAAAVLPPAIDKKSSWFVQVEPVSYEKVGTGGAYIPEDGAYKDRCGDKTGDSPTCGSDDNYLRSTKRYQSVEEEEGVEEKEEKKSHFDFYKVFGLRFGHSWFSEDGPLFGGASGAVRLYYGQASDTAALGFSKRALFSGDVSGHLGFRNEEVEGKLTLGPTVSKASGEYPLGEDLPFGNPTSVGIRGALSLSYYLGEAKDWSVGLDVSREQQIDSWNTEKIGDFTYHSKSVNDRWGAGLTLIYRFGKGDKK